MGKTRFFFCHFHTCTYIFGKIMENHPNWIWNRFQLGWTLQVVVEVVWSHDQQFQCIYTHDINLVWSVDDWGSKYYSAFAIFWCGGCMTYLLFDRLRFGWLILVVIMLLFNAFHRYQPQRCVVKAPHFSGSLFFSDLEWFLEVSHHRLNHESIHMKWVEILIFGQTYVTYV